ncbi:UPF0496 protein At1g20180-like [Silene latifolia]|uniref:UPF0496 protein At1g20180-like n=1 Tax=Silene latifolia TaxID=37657 RepID=UPI003D787ABE
MPRLFKSKEGSSKTTKDKEIEESLHESLNVSELYKEAFKSKSYADILSKFQSQLHKKPSSRFTKSRATKSTSLSGSFSSLSSTSFSVSSKINLHTCLLEPKQKLVLDSIKSSKLKGLLEEFFNITQEAYNVCELLLVGIQKTRYNNNFIKQRVQMLLSSDERRNNEMLIRELASFDKLSNPLSSLADFRKNHEGHFKLLNKLRSRMGKIKRKQKIIKFCKKLAGYGLLVAYSAMVTALIPLLLHSGIGLVAIPVLFLLPIAFRNFDWNRLRPSVREQLVTQLDVTARGSYILMNDFDTIGRLAVRVHDEVEHRKANAELCVRNGNNQQVVKQTLKELFKYENEFGRELDELEEQVYLCFVTINRIRKLVYTEISSA